MQGLQRIAEATDEERVVCKLSGLWTQWPGTTDPQRLEPWCQALLSVWGADRLIWGSDWPVLEMAGDYPRWRTASLDFLRLHCTAAELERVLDRNARYMYRL